MMFLRLSILSLLVVSLAMPAFAEQTIASRAIHVQGEGKVQVVPDHAVIDLDLTVKHKDARKAAKKSEKAVADIVAGLKDKFGVKATDLQTDMIRINPVYVNCHDKRELKRLNIDDEDCQEAMIKHYHTSRGLTVKYRDLANVPNFVSHVLGTALDNDTALSMRHISLKSSKMAELKDQARVKAAADAKTKAKTLANAMGAKLGEVLQIQVDNVFTPPIPVPHFARGHAGGAPEMATMGIMATKSADDYNPGNSFQPGEIEINATLSATFALD